MTRTLRFRVTALAALVVLAVLALAGAGLLLLQRSVLVENLDETLRERAGAVAADLRAGRPIDPRDLRGDDVLVQVVAGGQVVAASPELAGAAPWPAADGGRTLPDGAAARVVTVPAGSATVHAAGGLDDVTDSTGALLRALLWAVPLATAVLAGLVWLLVGRVLRPVEAIRAEVDRISAARLDGRVPEPATGDEVDRLARTMNAMLERLAAAADRQRRFVADAAHELRSPLARIRTELEVDRAHPAAADAARTRATLLAETDRLQRLVDDLLLLARADAGARRGPSETPVDLDEVALAAAAAHRAAGSVVVDTAGVAPVQVAGDAAALRRLVDNLLDNAVRHAGSRVTVTVGEDGATAVLTVADDGPGIPAGAREAVFERFTRLDEARTPASGGAGLGLAIARDAAVRHGGTLDLDGGGPGARFVLRLPVSSGRTAGGIGRPLAG
jgi:signal transduction histidine kinase